jgi:hypothetical protein
VQNVDKVQKELQRLRLAVKMWTMKAVTSMFGGSQGQGQGQGQGQHSDGGGGDGGDGMSVEALEREASSLLNRPDVANFVSAMNQAISEKVVGTAVSKTPRKVRLSHGAVLSPSPMRTGAGGGGARSSLYSPVRAGRAHHVLNAMGTGAGATGLDGVYSPPCSFPGVNGAYMSSNARESIFAAFPTLSALHNAAGSVVGGAGEVEETERLIARMMDVSAGIHRTCRFCFV